LKTGQVSLLLGALTSGWCAVPVAPIRLDDLLQSATITASRATSNARVTDPIVWQNFTAASDLKWVPLRGRVGYRNGDLMVKGEGSTPVILAPKEPAIDWSLYEAVELRMSAAGGSEVKIRIGDLDVKRKLGPPNQYQVYRFDVKLDAPKGTRPLAIMPTDSLSDLVAIRSIRLLPRVENFPQSSGRQNIGKRDEYRNALYVHAPATVSFRLTPSRNARLHVGLGVTAKDVPVKFRVQVEGVKPDLYSQTMSDPDSWADADVDLSAFAGRTIKLTLSSESAREGTVALWANPLITTAPASRRPNVLIYMIDTLRADHASLYGYSRETTPFLKKLGASGVVFDDCQAQATWTKASTASLMTSLYSFTHGIVNDYDTIPNGAFTLAEQLRLAGYVTASAVANPFAGRTTGLQRGFDYVFEYPVVLRNRSDASDRGTDSAAVNKLAFSWLERHREEPFFLYAHTTDPHAPYRPPAPFDAKFGKPSESAEFDRTYMKLRKEREYGGGTVINRASCAKAGVDPDRFITQAIDRYDGEILHNDKSFELLVGKLNELGVLDNTLIIVVSDHGEEFWDHGWTAHGHTVYQELTHSALLMWNPKLLPSARRVADPVQLIDVMPTVLDLLGLCAPNLIQGQSLVPLARGQAFRRRGPVMTSRFAHPGAEANGPVVENRTNSFGLIDSKWKLIYRDKAKESGINRVELYDRASDRAEKNNLAAQRPREVERMMAETGQWIEAQKKIRAVLGRGGKSTLDQQTIEQLRSLGYLGGSPQ
jgi:arylsulfatase A-like enzyme